MKIQNELKTKEAANLFISGKLQEAKEAYLKLSNVYGKNLFSANIKICDAKIKENFNEVMRIPSSLGLKKYSKQSNLHTTPIKSTPQRIEENLCTTEINKETHLLIEKKIPSPMVIELILTLKCCTNAVSNPKGLVADVSFYGSNGEILKKPYQGMAKSKKFGSYFYIEALNHSQALEKSYTILVPELADKIIIKIVPFNTDDTVSVEGGYSISSIENQKESFSYIESFNEVLSEAESIPDSNGSEYFTKHPLCVGVIGDIYMFNFYKDVFSSVHYLSPENYNSIISKNKLDLIIYTTCWKGIENEEWRGVKFREKPKKALEDILKHAKKNKIKTVFQSIEDPSNFEYFLPIAKEFDYILTTDTDCIENYKNQVGHNRVYFGEYGINPQLNNPIGSRRNIRNAAFFAGSYPKRYTDRCEDMEIIFDSIMNADGNLLIADRNFGSTSEELIYPSRFSSSILPPVQHALLQKVHKLFRYNLNFNSIKQSPTMCAMRVYELQAQGNGLISNYANSVFNRYPNVRIIPFKQEMKFDFYLDENWNEYKRNTDNIREVLNKKTSYQIVGKMLENIGFEKSSQRKNNTVAVICKKKTAKIVSSFESQRYQNKILIEESSIGNWNNLLETENIGYFCWFNAQNEYEKEYLGDLINGFKYTNCKYITKNAYFDKMGFFFTGPQHEYTNTCSAKCRSLFSTQYMNPLDIIKHGEDESFNLDNGYSIDPFELNFITHLELIKDNKNSNEENKKLSVIIPIYNNGNFLITKCIPSLQRNRIWHEMEILLVDDSSTDKETIEIINNLQRSYANIRVKFNQGGGSGSASRPRNQGIDMAKTPLITFLDPDNEIAPGAYDLLMDLYEEANSSSSVPVEFVSGFHVKVAEDVKIIGRHTSKKLSIIKNFKDNYFEKGKFPVIATQSAVISKNFLNKENIRFVEKSAGQDTLFGWELIAKSRCGAFTGDAYIIYYADRKDSITNQIDSSYFEKKLILEKEQVKFLKKHNIIQKFIDHHFDNFMNSWYLVKLNHVSKSNYKKSVETLEKICSLYEKDLKEYLTNEKTELAIINEKSQIIKEIIEPIIMPPQKRKKYYQFVNIIIKLLEKHKIQYFAHSGTLLGIIRHKGFIPWDDDVDIMVLQTEENKLRSFLADISMYGIKPGTVCDIDDGLIQLVLNNDKVFDGGYKYFMGFDIFIGMEENLNGHSIITYKNSNFRRWFKKNWIPFDDIFPLKNALFGPLEMPIPNRIETYFNNSGFSLSEAIIRVHNSSKEKAESIVSNLKELNLYPIKDKNILKMAAPYDSFEIKNLEHFKV